MTTVVTRVTMLDLVQAVSAYAETEVGRLREARREHVVKVHNFAVQV